MRGISHYFARNPPLARWPADVATAQTNCPPQIQAAQTYSRDAKPAYEVVMNKRAHKVLTSFYRITNQLFMHSR
jgi:hypothetical protein